MTVAEEEPSFGEYFDAQRDRLRELLSNKNAQQNIEWMEEYEKRQKEEKKVILPHIDHGIDIIGDEWEEEEEENVPNERKP